MKTRYLAGVLVTLASALLVFAAYGRGTREISLVSAAQAAVDLNGNMHVPEDYRTTYEFLGSWSVAVDQGRGSRELHVVYASPGTTSAYRNTGLFPTGTVLLKEVFAAVTAPMTTGRVAHAETLKGWFVLVRDTTGRYSWNRLWGDGWGWSWFDASSPSRTSSRDYRTDCLGCHASARLSEWVYVDGYPPLRP